MEVFNKITPLKEKIKDLKKKGQPIGFVPTMGTLHKGHLSLIKKSVEQCNITICSIFVNPIQFNNKEDLEKYPRDFEADKQLLKQTGCNFIFLPTEQEMYPEPIKIKYDFGKLETIMEGAFRPGHFNGVAIVVKKLFEIVEPHYAYFGEKDFQQLAIIKELVKKHNISTQIIACEIIREKDGLAMSSRNLRLNSTARKEAAFIYKKLLQAKQLVEKQKGIQEIKKHIIAEFTKNDFFELEYFEIADATTLLPLETLKSKQPARAFVAAYIGGIRLIDNIEIYS